MPLGSSDMFLTTRLCMGLSPYLVAGVMVKIRVMGYENKYLSRSRNDVIYDILLKIIFGSDYKGNI